MSLPVVFLHGIRLNGGCWVEQERLWGDRRVARPDLPGHGLRRGERFTVDAAVAAAVEAIDSVGSEAVLVGHSLGGYVAAATAAHHPERVAHLVLAGATLSPNALLRAPFRALHSLASLLPGNSGNADGPASPAGSSTAEAVSARILRATLPADIAEAVISGGIATEVIPDVMDAAATIDPLANLRCYPGPTLLVNGRHDHFRLQERRFLAAAGAGSLRVHPGGHYLPMTHGVDFATIVRDMTTRGTPNP